MKFFHFAHDYGFISPKSGGSDIYSHTRSVHSGIMQIGLRVTYRVVSTLVGGLWKLQAEHVIGAPIPWSQHLNDREQCLATKRWLWYKQFYVPSFWRGHHEAFSKPPKSCMPATCVVAASQDPEQCSTGVSASASKFSIQLKSEEDLWEEMTVCSDGEFLATSPAPSVPSEEIHCIPAATMAVQAATSLLADAGESREEFITEADEPASSRSPCYDACWCIKHTFLHVAVEEIVPSSSRRALSAPPRSKSYCWA